MASLDITLLRSFVAVVRAGSIRAAAVRVGRTQPAVSLQIKRLEDTVGEPLFHRTGSGVVLTRTGERLLQGAERILGAHDEALAGFRARGLQGAITFGCPEDYLTAFLPELLRDYGRRNPEVEIEIVSAPSVELRPMLMRRRVDLALVSVPPQERQTVAQSGAQTGVQMGAGTHEEVLRHEPLVWIAPPEGSRLLAEAALPLALSGAGTLDHRLAIEAIEASGRPYRITYASAGLAGLLAIARAGLAICVATGAAVPPDLAVLREGLPALPSIGMVVSYAAAQPGPVVRDFGDFLAARLRAP